MRAPHRRSRQRRGDRVPRRHAKHPAQHERRPGDLHREGCRSVHRSRRSPRRCRADPPDTVGAARAGAHDRTVASRTPLAVMRSRAAIPWWVLVLVSGAIAAAAVMRWIWAITLDGPVLYGEGAVAHAALLARQGTEYVAGARYGDVSPIFTAANYPPLYFHIAGLGDPFIAGRIAAAAKPTELFPAAGFVVVLLLARELRALALYIGGFALAAIATSLLTVGADGSVFMHVIDWNALTFHVDQAVLLVVVAILV